MFSLWKTCKKEDVNGSNEISNEHPKNDDTTEDDSPTFKRFEDTCAWISFGLVVNMMYPTRRSGRQQWWLTRIIMGYISSAFILCQYSMIVSLREYDLYNATRQMTITNPLSMMMFKIVFTNVKRELFRSIIDEMNSDNSEANEIKNPDYLEVFERNKKKCKIVEIIWIIMSLAVPLAFPTFAAVEMVKNNLVKNEQKRIMLHELILPVLNDYAHETPVFEIVFIYSLSIIFFCNTNFLGFDGSFCVTVSHCRAQLQIMTLRLRDLFHEQKLNLDSERLMKELGNIIRLHQKIYRFSDKIQAIYGGWMGILVFLTSIQICVTFFQLTEALKVNEVKMEFIIFTIGSMVQVYLPCTFGSLLTHASSQSAIDIYCCGWEDVKDPRVRSTLRIMIARAQKPIAFTAVYLMPINMETFISILNTSYSYFTLLRSGE